MSKKNNQSGFKGGKYNSNSVIKELFIKTRKIINNNYDLNEFLQTTLVDISGFLFTSFPFYTNINFISKKPNAVMKIIYKMFRVVKLSSNKCSGNSQCIKNSGVNSIYFVSRDRYTLHI